MNDINPKTPKRLLNVGSIAVNAHGRATHFKIFTKFNSFHVRNFWITTVTFWICFFVWFGNLNLLPWILKDIPMTESRIALSKMLLTLSTVIFRVIIGDCCDKIGVRYSYILVLVLSIIPVCLLCTISSSSAYIVLNFFVGIVGSSFVITQYHTTQFFVDRLIGLANATSAGWGNFGGGCAAIAMPALARHIEQTYGYNAWRVMTFASGLLLLIPIWLHYYFAVDTIEGNLNYKTMLTRQKLFDFSVLRATFRDRRTWILFLVYMICFGVEITVISFLQNYLRDTFNVSTTAAGLIVFVFSCLNLFARSVGGGSSDILYRKFGIQGRVYILFLVLIAEAIFLFIFGFSDFSLGYSIFVLLFFSFYVQVAEGVTYAIVPFVKIGVHKKIGPIYGIVAAGGNFGSFLFSSTIFNLTPNSQSLISYRVAFVILSLVIFVGAFSTLKIKFSAKEIRDADELLTSFLKMHQNEIAAQPTTPVQGPAAHADVAPATEQNTSANSASSPEMEQEAPDLAQPPALQKEITPDSTRVLEEYAAPGDNPVTPQPPLPNMVLR